MTAIHPSRTLRRRRASRAATACLTTAFVCASGMSVAHASPPTAYEFRSVPVGTAYSTAMAYAPNGDLYVSDMTDRIVTRYPAAGGPGVTFAGTPGVTGFAGDGGQATSAAIGLAYGFAFAPNGDVYFSDYTNQRIRKIAAGGVISTVAGNGTAGFSGDGVAGQAASAQLSSPTGLALRGNRLYISDNANDRVRVLDIPTATISTAVGGPLDQPIADGDALTAATLNNPHGLAFAPDGTLTIADADHHAIRSWNPTSGAVTTIVNTAGTSTSTTPTQAAGYTTTGGDGGAATAATLQTPRSIAYDSAGNLLIADSVNRRIRRVDAIDHKISTVAGNGSSGLSPTSGAATAGSVSTVYGMGVSPTDVISFGNTFGTPSQRQVVSLGHSPTVTSAAPVTAQVASPYSHSFTASGTPATITWSVNPAALPPGLTLSSAGVLSGTPTAAGTYPMTVTGSNGFGTAAAAAVTVTVNAAAPPAPPSSGAGGGGSSTPLPPAPGSPGSGPTVALTPGLSRIAGEDRISTATAIATRLFPHTGQAPAAVIATTETHADSVGGATLAAAAKGPMLLTSPDSLDSATAAELTRAVKPGSTVYVLGGTSAISTAVTDEVQAAGFTVVRIGGADRYETATEVADRVSSLYTATAATRSAGVSATPAQPPVYVASGTSFADALAVSALAAKTGGVVVLTAGSTMPTATDAWLDAHDEAGRTRTIVVGGPAAKALPGAKESLVGGDRYETAALVAAEFPAGTAAVGVASGTDWPDAVVGAAAMGMVGGPLLLTEPERLHSATAAFIGGRPSVGSAWLFGGDEAVSDGTAASLRSLTE